MGLNFLDANDQLRSLPEILAELRGQYGDTLDAVEKQELKKAFGTDEAIDMIDLMFPKLDQLQTNITDMNQNLKGGLSTTMDMAGNILNGPNESVERFNQRLGGLMITLGRGVAPAFQFVTDKVGGVLVMITNLLERFPMLTQVLGTLAIGLLTIKTAMIAAKLAQIGWNLAMITGINSMGIFAALQNTMALGSKAWAAAQWVLNAALTANPIGLIIAGVAALIGVVALVVKYWEPLGDFFLGLWSGITAAFASGFEYISGIVSTVSDWWNSLFGDEQSQKAIAVTQSVTTQGAGAVPAYVGGVAPQRAHTGIAAYGGAPQGYTDNSQTNFTIETTPGMNERDIADAVAKKLDERDRAKARSQRSNQYD